MHTYGIAKGATIHSVQIETLSGGTDCAAGVDGLEWVEENFSSPAVANFSYTGNCSSVRDAQASLVASGVVLTVAAGNDDSDACGITSLENSDGLVVGATAPNDSRWEDSNYGTCLDLLAPGYAVLAADIGPDSSLWSGTSMAAPYVAGVAAAVLDQNSGWNVSGVESLILGSATADALSDLEGSPNLLVNSLFRRMSYGGSVNIWSDPDTTTYYTYTAVAHGGSGSWTYTWLASVDGGSFDTVSTSSTYQRSISAEAEYDLTLRLEGTSAGETLSFEREITVTAPFAPYNLELDFLEGYCPDSSVHLTWNAGGYSDTKIIEVSLDEEEWEEVDTQIPQSNTFTDWDAPVEEIIYYRVRFESWDELWGEAFPTGYNC